MSVFEKFKEMQSGQPKLGAQLSAILREGIKDIRQTWNEVMLGHHEHAPEAGTPLNPTQIMTTDDLRPEDFNHYPHRHVEHDDSRSR